MRCLRANALAKGSETTSKIVRAAPLRTQARPAPRAAAAAAARATRGAPATTSAPAPPDTPRGPSAAALAAAAALSAALLAAPIAAPLPALADQTLLDVPACSKLQPAAQGIRYCDVRAGSGDSPFEGDLVLVDYTARALATGGKVFDGSSKFKFFVGQGEFPGMAGFDIAILGDGGAMPAVKEGGIRTVVLPPALAYGEKGDGCLYGLDNSCRIPPNSEVEITFRYNGLGYGK